MVSQIVKWLVPSCHFWHTWHALWCQPCIQDEVWLFKLLYGYWNNDLVIEIIFWLLKCNFCYWSHCLVIRNTFSKYVQIWLFKFIYGYSNAIMVISCTTPREELVYSLFKSTFGHFWQMWLFRINVVLSDKCGCLRKIWLLGINMVCCDKFGY